MDRILKDPRCLHECKFRCPYQNGHRIFSRKPDNVTSPPSLKQLSFLRHEWVTETFQWGLKNTNFIPPRAEKWAGIIQTDFQVEKKINPSILSKTKGCSECKNQRSEENTKKLYEHFQSPYLPRSFIFIDKNVTKPLRSDSYSYAFFRDHIPWHHFSNQLRLRRMDLHAKDVGILMTTSKTFLPTLQTLNDNKIMEVK